MARTDTWRPVVIRAGRHLVAVLLVAGTWVPAAHVVAHPLDPALLELRRLGQANSGEEREASDREQNPDRVQEPGTWPDRVQEPGTNPVQEPGTWPSDVQEPGTWPSDVQETGTWPSDVQETGTWPSDVQETGTWPDRVQKPGTWSVLWRVPRGQPRQAPLEPVLPDTCVMRDRPVATVGTLHLTWQVTLDCTPADLAGARIGVDGLDARETEVLVRVHRLGGEAIQAVLRAGDPPFAMPATGGRGQTLVSYGRLGVHHIVGGVDHLLFVLGLLFLVPGLRALLLTVTAFTVGHSITLSLAALGWLRVPQAPVELAIAASIWWVAVRLAGNSRQPSGDHTAWPIAVAFGWLHGLGFAGALAETGLPAQHVPLALLAFNLGIELGQVVFILVVVGLGALCARMWRPGGDTGTMRDRLALPAAYVIGSLAGYWMLERSWGFFAALVS